MARQERLTTAVLDPLARARVGHHAGRRHPLARAADLRVWPARAWERRHVGIWASVATIIVLEVVAGSAPARGAPSWCSTQPWAPSSAAPMLGLKAILG